MKIEVNYEIDIILQNLNNVKRTKNKEREGERERGGEVDRKKEDEKKKAKFCKNISD